MLTVNGSTQPQPKSMGVVTKALTICCQATFKYGDLSFPKIRSGGIRTVRQKQRIIAFRLIAAVCAGNSDSNISVM